MRLKLLIKVKGSDEEKPVDYMDGLYYICGSERFHFTEAVSTITELWPDDDLSL